MKIKVGDKVYCEKFGEGEVAELDWDGYFRVEFGDDWWWYDEDGSFIEREDDEEYELKASEEEE